MLKSLKIQNFRMIKSLVIPQLGRINLIVGHNNSGKSSILEALRIFTAKSSPSTLAELTDMHDESALYGSDQDQDPEGIGTPLNHPFKNFFFGRQFPTNDGENIFIGENGNGPYVSIEHAFYVDQFEEKTSPAGEIVQRRKRTLVPRKGLFDSDAPVNQGLQVTTSDGPGSGWIELSDGRLRPGANLFWDRNVQEVPVSNVPTRFLSMNYLAELWDKVLFTAGADDLKATLRIIDPDFEDIAFVAKSSFSVRSSERERFASKNRTERTAVVKLSSTVGSIPLNSMGDGMLRVLQLVLTIFPARGGILLVDEFENGLHWSVQEELWKSIFKLAQQLDIQVFATTHSEDAVRAFNNVCSSSNEDGTLIRLVSQGGKGEPRGVKGILYDTDVLKSAIDAKVEIR